MTARRLDFLLLGAPLLRLDGRPVTLPRRKSAALLFYLACRTEPLGRSAAAGMFWPEFHPDRARQSLRQALFEATRAAGGSDGESLFEGGGGYLRFAGDIGVETDSGRFGVLAERGLAGAASRDAGGEAGRALAEAELLYRGEFLEGFYLDDSVSFEEWQLAEAARLRSLAASVSTALARLELRSGSVEAAEAKARRAIEIAPEFELGHCVLLEALARAGDAGAARAHAEAYAERLREEWGRKPGPAFEALVGRIDREAPAPRPMTPLSASPVPDPPRLHGLPRPPTGLVGRERELGLVARALRPGALLSLVGTGGIGKTRLALEAAARLAADYPDGAAFVDLVPCLRDEEVTLSIASTLGLRLRGGGAASLPDYLGSLRLLLVLDNCEQVLQGAAEAAARITAACPGVAVLATSRESLGLPGETVLEVLPLAVPDPGEAARDPVAALGFEAPRLLVERARAASPGYEAGPGEAVELAALCARLDGLPLALELAAPRLALLGAKALRSLLEARILAPIELLSGASRDPRAAHRALRALFDWSWEGLDGEERAALARLSVFRGSFGPEAAVAICGERSARAILALADKMLLSRDRAAEGRFRLLETVKAYAAWRLEDGGGVEAARRAHVDWFSALAAKVEGELRVLRNVADLERAALDLDEFDGAAHYAIEIPGLLGAAAGIAGRLVDLFRFRGRMGRLAAILDAIAPRAEELGEGRAAADLAFAEGNRRLDFFEGEAALAAFDRAAELYRGLGEALKEAYSLCFADLCAPVVAEWSDTGFRRTERARALFIAEGATQGAALSFLTEAQGLLDTVLPPEGAAAAFERIEALLREGLPYAGASGDIVIQGQFRWFRARWATQLQDLEEAERSLRAAEGILAPLDDPGALGDIAFLEAGLAYREGRIEEGVEAARRAVEQRRRSGIPVMTAMALRLVAAGLERLGRVDDAVALMEEAVRTVGPANQPFETAFQRFSLALLEFRRGNVARARDITAELVAAGRSGKDRRLMRSALVRAGRLAMLLGEDGEAAARFREAMTTWADANDRGNFPRVFLGAVDPAGLDPAGILRCLGTYLLFRDDHAACAAMGLGLRLARDGAVEVGVATAARGVAWSMTNEPMFWYAPERAVAARVAGSLRDLAGAAEVDRALEEASDRYRKSRPAFFRELGDLLPALEAAVREPERPVPREARPAAAIIPAVRPRPGSAPSESGGEPRPGGRPSPRRREVGGRPRPDRGSLPA